MCGVGKVVLAVGAIVVGVFGGPDKDNGPALDVRPDEFVAQVHDGQASGADLKGKGPANFGW